MSEQNRHVYETACDDLLALVYSDHAVHQQIRFEYGLKVGYMPQGCYRDALRAMYDLYDNGDAVHITAIMDKAPKCDEAWLLQRFVEQPATITAKKNVEIARKYGLHYGRMSLIDGIRSKLEQESVEQSAVLVDKLVSYLAQVGNDTHVQHVTAKDHAQRNRASWNSTDVIFGKLDMPTMNKMIAGYERGQLLIIAGAYKQRKTTLALNMLLRASCNHISTSFHSGEMLQNEIQAYLESMLAYNYGVQRQWDSKTFNGVEFDWLSPVTIRRFYGRYDKLSSEHAEAIGVAQDKYEGLNHRIYDSTPIHGGLVDRKSLKTAILADTARFGTKVHYVDYIQLFKEADESEYEGLVATSEMLRQVAIETQTCIVALAQRNEATIANDKGYSPGISGGGATAKAAHCVWTTSYNNGVDMDNPNKLKINLSLARYAPQKTFGIVDIHPASGLILEGLENL